MTPRIVLSARDGNLSLLCSSSSCRQSFIRSPFLACSVLVYFEPYMGISLKVLLGVQRYRYRILYVVTLELETDALRWCVQIHLQNIRIITKTHDRSVHFIIAWFRAPHRARPLSAWELGRWLPSANTTMRACALRIRRRLRGWLILPFVRSSRFPALLDRGSCGLAEMGLTRVTSC